MNRLDSSTSRHTAPRLLALLACALLLFLLFPQSTARAAALSTGRISGRLLNGSHHDASVANQSVTLQLAENNTAHDLVTIKTDAQGSYTFSALQSDSTVQYAIYTYYQKAQYSTDLIDLSKKTDQQVNLTVFDATSSMDNIAVVQASILLDKPNPQTGTLTVSEDFFFENMGSTAYVGNLDVSHGKPNALIFSLPSGAKLLALGAGFDGYNSIQVDGGFASNAAVPPDTSRFSFSFQVPYSGSGYQFTYKAIYPTVALSILTPTTILTTPRGLTSKGTTDTKTGIYELFQAQNLRANNSVQAQLDGLPTPAQPNAQPSALNPNLTWLVVLLIVLLALAGVGGYLYNTRRRKAAGSRRRPNVPSRKGAAPARKKAVASASKEALLQEMLELDKAYEAHKIKKAVHQEQRARLKARLRNLMSEQAEQTEQAQQAASKQTEKRVEARGKAARSSSKGEK